MPTIAEYLDAAKARGKFASDTRLSIALGQGPSWASQIRRGIACPGEDAMMRLAELAGISPDIALLDLARERARDPRVRSTWANILQRIAVAVVAALLPIGAARVSVENAQEAKTPYKAAITVYYQKSKARFRAEVLALITAIFRLLLTNQSTPGSVYR